MLDVKLRRHMMPVQNDRMPARDADRNTQPARTRMTTRDDRQHIFGRSPPSGMRMPHFEKTQIEGKIK